MITFEGDNYKFEVFSYYDEENNGYYTNMGRIHFLHSSIGIDYIEGTLYETEKEFVENCFGVMDEIITEMTIMGIHKIRFKNGEEITSESLKDMKIGLAIPSSDPLDHIMEDNI